MNFTLSQEQQQLQQSVARFVEREYSIDQRQQVLASEQGFSEKHWQTFAELGWLGLIADEQYGGFGGSAIELMTVCEQLGRGLVAEPYLPALLAMELVAKAAGTANSDVAADLIRPFIDGDQKIAAALYETSSRFEVECIQTRAEQSGDGFVVNGSKTLVLAGGGADKLVVSARLQGQNEALQKGELALFLVDAQQPGVTLSAYSAIDGSPVAELKLHQVALAADSLLASGEAASKAIEHAIDTALIGYGAEALGAMDVVLAMTVDYAGQRQQFGQAIGRFQAVQHALADMYIACESLRSLLYAAGIKHSESAVDAPQAVAALSFKAAEAGRKLAEQAVQLHGAMGFTEELSLSYYYKRLVCIAALFGDADFYLARYSALSNS